MMSSNNNRAFRKTWKNDDTQCQSYLWSALPEARTLPKVQPGEIGYDHDQPISISLCKEHGFVSTETCPSESDDGCKLSEGNDCDLRIGKRSPIKTVSSLKTLKTPCMTVEKKVRFADVFGLDLENIHYVLNSCLPDVSKSLHYLQWEDICHCREYEFQMKFSQPGSEADFFQKVRHQHVSLENCVANGCSTIFGVVRVVNCGYEKVVEIRYTFNSWRSHQEVKAEYVHDDLLTTDKFSFHISIPSNYSDGFTIQFAIQYVVNGKSYWDNNEGQNYEIICAKNAVKCEDFTLT